MPDLNIEDVTDEELAELTAEIAALQQEKEALYVQEQDERYRAERELKRSALVDRRDSLKAEIAALRGVKAPVVEELPNRPTVATTAAPPPTTPEVPAGTPTADDESV